MALVFSMSLLVVALLWLVVIVYGRRPRAAPRQANALAVDHPVVEWQAGRWDKGNAGRLFVANVGDDTAHEVSLVASDRHDKVALKVDRIPPYQPGDEQLPEPCYVEFSLKYRATHGPDPADANVEADDGRQVEVQLTWRSEHGRWSAQTLHTG